jgi:hypothetical protein
MKALKLRNFGMNCRALTCRMKVCYVCHKWDSSLLFQCITVILWVSITFCWVSYIKEAVYDWLFVRVILAKRVICWKSIDVSEEHIASIFREEYAEQETSAEAGGKSIDFQRTTLRYIAKDRILQYWGNFVSYRASLATRRMPTPLQGYKSQSPDPEMWFAEWAIKERADSSRRLESFQDLFPFFQRTSQRRNLIKLRQHCFRAIQSKEWMSIW